MIFTGSNLTISRSLFTQTGTFGFNLACTVDNTTGVYRFGLTGAPGALEFRLQSGRMYYQNQFIHAYRSNEEFLVDTQLTSGHVNVIRNGAALEYADRKVTGAFDTFYFMRENAGMNADFDLNVSGDSIPLYTITSNGYLTNTGQGAVTGYFINSSPYPIRVFDSTIQASQFYAYGKLVTTIGAGATGAFAYSGDWTTIDTTDPILTTFNTNFGDTNILFSILNVASYNRFIQFTGPNDFTFNQTGILNRTLTYLNFSGGFAGATFPTDLMFSLAYISGSGTYIDASGNPYTKTFTGSWNLYTGIDNTSLVQLPEPNSTIISGSGNFASNSQMIFQIAHNITDTNSDGARLIVSGSQVINPINIILTN